MHRSDATVVGSCFVEFGDAVKANSSATSTEKKVCAACQTVKLLSEFHRFGKGKQRVGKWCEPCFEKNNGRRRRPAPSDASSNKV